MKATKQIDIYLTQKRNVRTVDVVQYDTCIQLVFNFKDFSIPSDASATLYVQKPSGKFVLQEDGITISGNTITIALENQAITEHGKIPYQVGITSGSEVITTFTGLIMVEKSMKDAGATESITVIRAFDEAVSVRVADFHTKAEQIVQACIATIPADYTAMAAKVSETANAVKGYLSGDVVRADDVSTVEHNMKVWVHGKNLVSPSESGVVNGLTYSCVNGEWSISGTPSVKYTVLKNAEITELLKDGEIYTISQSRYFESVSASGAVYLQVTAENYSGTHDYIASFSGERSFTVDKSKYKSYIMRVQSGASLDAVSLTGLTFQLERGSTATAYTPYIAPSAVTVKRYGKNILPTHNTSQNGYKVTKNGDGSVTVTGASDTAGAVYLNLSPVGTTNIVMKKGVRHRLSWYSSNGRMLHLKLADSKGEFKWITANHFDTLYETDFMTIVQFYVQIGANNAEDPNAVGDTSLCGTYRFQIEVAEEVTNFEAFKEPDVYIPNQDGTVPGITSLSPCMTILTDTEGVIVECEYNRDTNKVIEKLTNAIIALGGTI